jgi:hypothetical protein
MADAGAGLSWVDIAGYAYRAYAANTGNKNFRGEEMPAFEDLPQPIRVAWEAAVRQTADCLGNINHPFLVPGVDRWAGWLPPQFREKGDL